MRIEVAGGESPLSHHVSQPWLHTGIIWKLCKEQMLGLTLESLNELVWVQSGYLDLQPHHQCFSGATRAESWGIRRKNSEDQVKDMS